MYDEIRESLLPSSILHNNTWTTTEKFTQIMLNQEKLKTTAKFVYQAFAERQIKLDVLKHTPRLSLIHRINPQKP